MLKHLQALIITGVLSLFCISQAIASDTLVVYFSRSGNQFNGNITEGNTAIVAKIIAQELNADTFEIKPKEDGLINREKELNETESKLNEREKELNEKSEKLYDCEIELKNFEKNLNETKDYLNEKENM